MESMAFSGLYLHIHDGGNPWNLSLETIAIRRPPSRFDARRCPWREYCPDAALSLSMR
jgi:hypothetical protein